MNIQRQKRSGNPSDERLLLESEDLRETPEVGQMARKSRQER